MPPIYLGDMNTNSTESSPVSGVPSPDCLSLSLHTHSVAADARCPLRSGLALWGDECAFVGSKDRTQTATDRQAALEEGLMAEGKKESPSGQYVLG